MWPRSAGRSARMRLGLGRDHVPAGQARPRGPGCPARPLTPDPRRASASGTRQSTPTTSAPGFGHQPQQLAGADPEVDAGHAEVRQAGQDLGAGGQDVAAVVVRAEASRPSCRRAGRPGRPPPPGLASDASEPCRPAGPAARPTAAGSWYIERLGLTMVAGRAALDQVAGQGERAPRRSRSAGTASSWPEDADGLEHVGGVLLGLEGPEPVEVRRRPRTAASTTGPIPGCMSTPNPMAATGTTMSENRMAASTPYRRTGWRVSSAASSGIRRDVEDAAVAAGGPVFRQGPSGLAHEPHRRVRHRLAPAGGQERARRRPSGIGVTVQRRHLTAVAGHGRAWRNPGLAAPSRWPTLRTPSTAPPRPVPIEHAATSMRHATGWSPPW